VVVPFFDYGIPVEYELIRSINTVAQTDRQRIGVVRTDAQLFGGFSFAGGQPRQIPRQAIIEELEKQYDVEEVDLMQPVTKDRFDVLLVVQPSSLAPESMEYLLEAIREGIPTAVFEDPLPAFMAGVPGTGQPKEAPGGMMGMGARPLPKADIRQLWDLLGIESPGSMGREGLFQPDLVWQDYNPYPKLQVSGIPDQWIFVREEPGEPQGLISPDSVITSGLDELFFPFPGLIEPNSSSDLKFTKLVQTRDISGTIGFEQLIQYQNDDAMLRSLRRRRGGMTLAALIESEPDTTAATASPEKGDATEETDPAEEDSPPGNGDTPTPIKVVYVTDIDLMIPAFLRIRARPDEQEEIKWQFENVTFLLNIIDYLARDTDYIDIRKRKPRYSTLQVVESRVEEAREREFARRLEFQAKYDKAVQDAETENEKTLEKFQTIVNDLQKRQSAGEEIDEDELRRRMLRAARSAGSPAATWRSKDSDSNANANGISGESNGKSISRSSERSSSTNSGRLPSPGSPPSWSDWLCSSAGGCANEKESRSPVCDSHERIRIAQIPTATPECDNPSR
jgi:ABC-2 type transport system permease protein